MEPEVFIELVKDMRGTYTIMEICECFGIPRSTYYRWKDKDFGVSPLEALVLKICRDFRYRIGHRMVRGLLKKEHSIHVHRNTVQKIMQKFGAQCRVKPKRKVYIAGAPQVVVPNRLAQNFKAENRMKNG